MTIIVSVSQFRQNIAEYIEKVKQGNTVILQDKKKDQRLAELVAKRDFDPQAFGRALSKASGIFTAENHPEWKTKQDVMRWIEKGRLASDRAFKHVFN